MPGTSSQGVNVINFKAPRSYSWITWLQEAHKPVWEAEAPCPRLDPQYATYYPWLLCMFVDVGITPALSSCGSTWIMMTPGPSAYQQAPYLHTLASLKHPVWSSLDLWPSVSLGWCQAELLCGWF